MKKLAIALVIAIAVVGVASAQPFGGMGRGYGFSTLPQAAAAQIAVPQKATLEGSLVLVDGRVAIKKDASTYYVMIPGRLYGFVDGLKEGAAVKLEGYSHEVPGVADTFVFRAYKIELNGKTIDLGDPASATANVPFGMGRGMMPNMGGRGMGNGRSFNGRPSNGPMGGFGWR